MAFTGVTGRVRIDANGARDADYAILDLDPITGRFEVVARYYGEARNYSPVVGKHIHWPGGLDGPPKDVPSCGFLGNECDSKGERVPTNCKYTRIILYVYDARSRPESAA